MWISPLVKLRERPLVCNQNKMLNHVNINFRGKLPYQSDGVIIEHFERKPPKVPDSRFVGVAQVHFHP